MSFANVQVEKVENIGVLTLDHPPANALNQPTFSGIADALEALERDTEVKVVLIKGNGRFFAAGADIKEFTTIQTAEEAAILAKRGQQVFDRIEQFSKPVIAAIHGAALGGGLELAMACHIRFATPEAKVGLPELNLGLIPGFAGTQRLPRIVGKAKALELLFSGQPINGEEAQKLGLVNQCFAEEELFEKALQYAKLVASKSAVTLSAVLGVVAHGEKHGFDEGAAYEAEWFGKVFATADAKEGIQAFIEKRKPNFKDQ